MRLLSALAPPLCSSCRGPARPGDPLCGACRRRLAYLPSSLVLVAGVEVWAPLAYEGPARAAVRRLKFHGAAALADHMAAAIAANAPDDLLALPLVPVPTPSWRRRRRGFCHAELLARALARRRGLEVLCVLERVGGVGRQVGRARAERVNAPPRFRAVREGTARVLLIDDVVTTGATLAACARALREGGWDPRAGLAFARTPVR